VEGSGRARRTSSGGGGRERGAREEEEGLGYWRSAKASFIPGEPNLDRQIEDGWYRKIGPWQAE
jgi:hypothetical protein